MDGGGGQANQGLEEDASNQRMEAIVNPERFTQPHA
jgi:hypothetical protein